MSFDAYIDKPASISTDTSTHKYSITSVRQPTITHVKHPVTLLTVQSITQLVVLLITRHHPGSLLHSFRQ